MVYFSVVYFGLWFAFAAGAAQKAKYGSPKKIFGELMYGAFLFWVLFLDIAVLVQLLFF